MALSALIVYPCKKFYWLFSSDLGLGSSMCTTTLYVHNRALPRPPRTPTAAAAAVHTRILPIGGMRRHPPVPTWVPSEQNPVSSLKLKLQLKTSSCRIWLLDSIDSIPWSLKSITCILQSLFCYKCYHHECCCYLMNPFHGVCPTWLGRPVS